MIPLLVHAAILAGQLAPAFRSRAQLQAEIAFLRRQLALYQERSVRPRRPNPASR